MWRSESNWRQPGRICRGRGTAMAHRRGFVCGQAFRAGLAVAALTAVVAGSVYVSTEVTRLRARVAELGDERECLKALGAELEQRWIAQTSPAAIGARVSRETDLRAGGAPDFVLVTREAPASADDGFLHKVIAGLTGGATANAAPPPRFVSGNMVSLTPRTESAHAAGSTP